MDSDNKSWFARHKFITIILVVAILAAVFTMGKGSNDNTESNNSQDENSNSTSAEKEFRFADRADKQDKDKEILPEESATISDVKLTVKDIEYTTELNDFEKADEGKTYVVASVVIENVGKETKPYNTFDFRIQTAGGQVLDTTLTSEPYFSSGDLVSGGKVEGKVYFEVPEEDGHQYIIWKPGLDSDRVIIQAK
jgi:hypothetical protein